MIEQYVPTWFPKKTAAVVLASLAFAGTVAGCDGSDRDPRTVPASSWTVKPGDTLSQIAQEYCDNKLTYDESKDVVADISVTNDLPNTHPAAGHVLRIPVDTCANAKQ
jgi:hypothetical protein